MNKKMLLGQRQYFDMAHGVTVRAIGTFEDKDLDFRPTEETRSVRELILHIYSMEKAMTEGARDGKVTTEAETAAAESANVTTVAEAQEFARNCHKAADAALAAMSDEDLARMVEAPYGSFPAWQYFTFAYDEHWHHRGQLYTYLRLLGKEPPMLYDYENFPA